MNSRNNTVTSMAAMSPSMASSPIRSTFAETKAAGRASSPAINGGRPPTARGRQNSTQSIAEHSKQRPPSVASNKQNGSGVGTPDPTGRSASDIKSTRESGATSKGEHLDDSEQGNQDSSGSLLLSKENVKREESVPSGGEPMSRILSTTITTKSGRASKPSTPAIPQFPEPIRSRSSRNTTDTAANNKRSHKKGAGVAAQQLRLQQGTEEDEGSSMQDEEDEEGGNLNDEEEKRYCYCNEVSYGEMVGCDSEACEREWFHLECVGLKVPPKSHGNLFS
jgi:hypothetical protein